jgi:hypothetical protein
MHASTRLLLAGAVLAATAIAAPAQEVGTMTMEQVHGHPRRRTGHRRHGIALGDRLAANATGTGIIVFKDESTARMGPNAELTIDEFVYNPSRRTGTIRLRQTKGIARIYGGQISKRGRSEIRTPHIVLVVRGGIADVSVDDVSVGTNLGGILTCSVGDLTRTITNPGMSCVSDGQSLTITRNTQAGGPQVTPAGQGTGTPGSTNYDQANCASASATAACKSDNGGLPAPGTTTQGSTPLGGGAPGGGL